MSLDTSKVTTTYFGNIMSAFTKSKFGAEKKEYSSGSLNAMYTIFSLLLAIPIVYMLYLQFYVKSDVYKALMSKDVYLVKVLVLLLVVGLIGLIVVGTTTKKKDGFSAMNKKPMKKFGVDHTNDKAEFGNTVPLLVPPKF